MALHLAGSLTVTSLSGSLPPRADRPYPPAPHWSLVSSGLSSFGPEVWEAPLCPGVSFPASTVHSQHRWAPESSLPSHLFSLSWAGLGGPPVPRLSRGQQPEERPALMVFVTVWDPQHPIGTELFLPTREAERCSFPREQTLSCPTQYGGFQRVADAYPCPTPQGERCSQHLQCGARAAPDPPCRRNPLEKIQISALQTPA